MQEYLIVDIRFMFFNGKDNYTVEYSTGLDKWFIFKDREMTGALESFKPSKKEKITAQTAREHFEYFLTTLKTS